MKISLKEKVESVINDYDDIAKEYCDEFEKNDTYNTYINKWLKLVESGKILDAGCGCANNCCYINSINGFDCIGIDLSDNMLNEAHKRNPSCIVEKMDMTDIKYEDNSFDGILSNCSMIHIPKELVLQTLENFKRVLKPNARLLLILLEGNGEEMLEEPFRVGMGVYVYTKYYKIEEIIEVLHSSGFTIEDIDVKETESDMELGGRELIIYGKNTPLLETQQYSEKCRLLKKLSK